MRKSLSLTLTLALLFCLITPTAMAKHYQEELAANVTIDAEIDETVYDNLKQFTAVYLNLSNEADCEKAQMFTKTVAPLLFRYDVTEAELTYDSDRMTIDNDRESLFLSDSRLTYTRDEVDQCYWHIVRNINDYLAPDPIGFGYDNFYGEDYSFEDLQTEHDYMSFEEADKLARSLIQACAGDDRLQPVLRCSYSLTHEQCAELRQIIAEKDALYRDNPGNAEMIAFDDWSEADDYYILHYTYTFDGAPVYDHSYNISVKEGEPDYTSLSAECHINRDGVCFLSAEYIIPDEEDEPQSAMTTDEAVQTLRDYFSETYVSIPVEITSGHIEYLPRGSNESSYLLTFIPVWTFTADLLTTVGRYENAKSYQFNAITGEPLSWS